MKAEQSKKQQEYPKKRPHGKEGDDDKNVINANLVHGYPPVELPVPQPTKRLRIDNTATSIQSREPSATVTGKRTREQTNDTIKTRDTWRKGIEAFKIAPAPAPQRRIVRAKKPPTPKNHANLKPQPPVELPISFQSKRPANPTEDWRKRRKTIKSFAVEPLKTPMEQLKDNQQKINAKSAGGVSMQQFAKLLPGRNTPTDVTKLTTDVKARTNLKTKNKDELGSPISRNFYNKLNTLTDNQQKKSSWTTTNEQTINVNSQHISLQELCKGVGLTEPGIRNENSGIKSLVRSAYGPDPDPKADQIINLYLEHGTNEDIEALNSAASEYSANIKTEGHHYKGELCNAAALKQLSQAAPSPSPTTTLSAPAMAPIPSAPPAPTITHPPSPPTATPSPHPINVAVRPDMVNLTIPEAQATLPEDIIEMPVNNTEMQQQEAALQKANQEEAATKAQQNTQAANNEEKIEEIAENTMAMNNIAKENAAAMAMAEQQVAAEQQHVEQPVDNQSCGLAKEAVKHAVRNDAVKTGLENTEGLERPLNNGVEKVEEKVADTISSNTPSHGGG